MQLINLLELSQINREQSRERLTSDKEPLIPEYLQSHLQLIIKQMHMGLSVQPILDNNPLLQQWVDQLQDLSSNLFKPQKKLFIDVPLVAKLNLPNQDKFIDIRANVGIVKGKPRLFEWAVRHPVISWQDRVKLWVATQYFGLKKSELKMVILALHPTKQAEKIIAQWNQKQHQQTQQWLVNLLTNKLNRQSTPKTYSDQENLLNIDEIEEVVL
ncbi:MAG: hypothetical protein AB4426_19450 [Xenococcaceae cyanobacterium]